MPTYRRAHHSVSLLHAHLVFVTKYRRPVFTDAMLTFTEDTMPAVCTELDVEWCSSTAKPTTCTGSSPPTNPGDLGFSATLLGPHSLQVRREYTGACVRARMRGHLWSPSHFAVSCEGAPLSIIKQCVHGQARPL